MQDSTALSRYVLYGGLGSPYSMKVRAVLRYRRIPHDWVQFGLDAAAEPVLAQVKVPVIPVLKFPDGRHLNDSTPLIHLLEQAHPGQRSVIPPDPAQAFLASLLEDMADEWGTKAMFLYRWLRDRDQQQMSQWLAFDRLAGQGRSAIQSHADKFRDRQVGRMALVGCTEANAPLVEASTDRILQLLSALVLDSRYMFGSRPSIADFGWLGQFSQLITDPTPNEHLRSFAPWVVRWLMQLDDASGVEGEWRAADAPLPPGMQGLLDLSGALYFPFLEANAAAVAAGQSTFRIELWGLPYEQAPFKYQVRCLAELRAQYQALASIDRERVDAVLPAGARKSLQALS
jgi:glutathione S-transferase